MRKIPGWLAGTVILLPGWAGAQTNTVLIANTSGTPVPLVGAGYRVESSPHVEINLSYQPANRTFSIGFRNDANGVQYAGTDAIVHAVTNQRTTIPSGSQWAFLGTSGGTFWSFPATLSGASGKKALYLGFSGYGVTANLFTGTGGGEVHLRVHAIENLTQPGAGHFYAYETSGSTPLTQLSSASGYNNSYRIFSGGHAHLNLAFTASGMFRIWFVARGTLAGSGEIVESHPLPLYFGVEEWQIPVQAPATGYEAWKLAKFSSSQATNSAVSGWEADPDGDGAKNLVEYAMNGNPMAPGNSHRPQMQTTLEGGQEFLSIRFQRRKGDSTLHATVENTSDLSAPWSTGAVQVGAPTPVDADYEQVVYRAPLSKTDAKKQYLRVRVVKN